jgi:hypothetical protein
MLIAEYQHLSFLPSRGHQSEYDDDPLALRLPFCISSHLQTDSQAQKAIRSLCDMKYSNSFCLRLNAFTCLPFRLHFFFLSF